MVLTQASFSFINMGALRWILSCILLTSTFLISHAEDEPQPVLIESDETWQSGIVLIYSTAILIALRLASTIRHSPLSPIYKSVLRLHVYAIAMFLIGTVSSLTILLLSVFESTRETARDLMPCAAPLLGIGGVLVLYPQTQPPQWEGQVLASLMGVPAWLVFITAVLFNGMTVAASVLNGAWAATSISLATTLVAIFGPRTPIVRNTVGNGIVEAGGPLIFKVRQHDDKSVIALSYSRNGKFVREFEATSWLNLQTIEEFRHDGRLRIGAYPRVSKVVVNEEQCDGMNLLNDKNHRYESVVQLISGVTSDTIGYIPLRDWMQSPFGDDVIAVEISMTDFTLEMLGSVVWSSCMSVAEKDFPGAFEAYGMVFRRLFEPTPRPDFKQLGMKPVGIDLTEQMGVLLEEYDRKILQVERMIQALPQPHKNIMRVVLLSKVSVHYEIHQLLITDYALDAVAGVVSQACKSGIDDSCSGVDELCVIFDGIDDGLLEDDEMYAVLTDKRARSVHWIAKDDMDTLGELLSTRGHAIISSSEKAVSTTNDVAAITLRKDASGRLELSDSRLPSQKCVTLSEELSQAQWNESRLGGQSRIWPINYEREEPAFAVAAVKGMAEVASLQAITSGIAAGSVLFGRLLGA